MGLFALETSKQPIQTNKQKEDQQKSGHGEEEAYSRIYPLTNLNWAPHADSGHLCSLP